MQIICFALFDRANFCLHFVLFAGSSSTSRGGDGGGGGLSLQVTLDLAMNVSQAS